MKLYLVKHMCVCVCHLYFFLIYEYMGKYLNIVRDCLGLGKVVVVGSRPSHGYMACNGFSDGPELHTKQSRKITRELRNSCWVMM